MHHALLTTPKSRIPVRDTLIHHRTTETVLVVSHPCDVEMTQDKRIDMHSLTPKAVV